MKLSAQKDPTTKHNSICVFDLEETPHKIFGRHQLFYFNEFISTEEDVKNMCDYINNHQIIPKTYFEINYILEKSQTQENTKGKKLPSSILLL